MSCHYYPGRLLEEWDSVCNPIGDYCYDCDEYECKHNANILTEEEYEEYYEDYE